MKEAEGAWNRLALRLDLPVGCFGDWAATEFMLDVARKASRAKEDLSAIDRALKALKFCSAPLDDVRDRLKMEALACRHRLGAFPAKGPTRVDAYFVAEKVARAFVEAGRSVRFGTKDDGVSPSTVFGKAVARALEELGVEASWRGAAKAAVKKHGPKSNAARRVRAG